jgi:hypothetical protein
MESRYVTRKSLTASIMAHHDRIIGQVKIREPSRLDGSGACGPKPSPCSPTWPGNGRVVRSIAGRQSLGSQPIGCQEVGQ